MTRRPYHPSLDHVPFTAVLDQDGDYAELIRGIIPQVGLVDRISLDRWLLIQGFLRREQPTCPSLLDLGCSSGFFSILFRVASSNRVTAVDDRSAISAGYGSESVLDGLRSLALKYGLTDIEYLEHDSRVAVRNALATGRSWDIVLCLGLLHHLLRGYGDLQKHHGMDADAFDSFLTDLGKVVSHHLFVEVDETRVGDVTAFFERVSSCTGLGRMTMLGWSCSGPGRPRRLMAFSRGLAT